MVSMPTDLMTPAKRWRPFLLIALCLIEIATASVFSPNAPGAPVIWVPLAGVAALFAGMFAFTNRLDHLRLWTVSIIVLGVVRSFVFALEGRRSAPGIWVMVAVMAWVIHVETRRDLR